MPIDLSNQKQKIKIKNDELLLSPDSKGTGFAVLHEGDISYSVFPLGNGNGKKTKRIPINKISGPAFFGQLSMHDSSFKPYCHALSKGMVSVYPTRNIGYLFKEKPVIGSRMLSDMLNNLQTFYTKLHRYNTVYSEFNNIISALILILSNHNYQFSLKDIINKKNNLVIQAQNSNTDLNYDASLFDKDLNYLQTPFTAAAGFSKESFQFFREILKVDPQTITLLFQKNLHIPMTAFTQLSRETVGVIKNINTVLGSLFKDLQHYFINSGGLLSDLQVFFSQNSTDQTFKQQLQQKLAQKLSAFINNNKDILQEMIPLDQLQQNITSINNLDTTASAAAPEAETAFNETEPSAADTGSSEDAPPRPEQEKAEDENIDDFLNDLDTGSENESISSSESEPAQEKAEAAATDQSSDQQDQQENKQQDNGSSENGELSFDENELNMSEEDNDDQEQNEYRMAGPPKMWEEVHTQELTYPPATINYKKETFKHYFDKIAEYAELDNDTYKRLKKNLKIIGTNPDNVKIADENRKTARQINKDFLSLYANVIIKEFKNENMPPELEYFLYYGLLTENYVDKELIQFIYEIKDEHKPAYTIITFKEWLRLIYDGKEIPSINEFGIDYNKFMREQKRRLSAKEKAELDNLSDEEKAKNRVKYELDNMFKVVSTMVAPNRSSRFYPLTNKLSGNPAYSYMLKEKIENLINELKSYDFSVFYRETLYQRKNFIQKEVTPYFVLLPLCGDKVVFWQDIAANKKNSKARFFIPIFLNGNLRSSMVKALANFRWEICRTVKGALWQNPVDGGLTGAFYDFITFFKKNSKLTIEAKEKLRNIVKNNRKDPKKIFFLFYYQWIEYERRGIMKLDRLSRDIFFKFCPFSKHIRDFLERIPVFAHPINRYNNIQKREVTKLEAKYKKKRDANGELPPELQENLDFIKK
ncbi:MAG TPA: hypothetical protein VKS21_02990 [Spirochaetota bacterium]|nr:hypothetical protein [Spirochaetota bacterium]